MSEKKRNLLFFEICGGDMSREAQNVFEKMQKIVERNQKKLSMTIKITVSPAKRQNGMPKMMGEIEYQITPPTLKIQSDPYITEVNKQGIIINDGKDIADALQEELRLELEDNDNTTIPFKQVGEV